MTFTYEKAHWWQQISTLLSCFEVWYQKNWKLFKNASETKSWKLKASKLDLFLCLSFSIFSASYTGKVCMVLLQIHSQLSDQTIHLLCKCSNDKIMKIPFTVFQTIFLVSHVVLYISTVGLSCIHSSKEIIHSTRLLHGLKWDQVVYSLGKKFIKLCITEVHGWGNSRYLVLNQMTQKIHSPCNVFKLATDFLQVCQEIRLLI